MFISIYFLLLHITWVFGRNDASCSDDDASSITELISQIFRNSLGSTCACGILEFILPGQVFLPGATNYTVENTHYWDLREDLSPKCVFVPETAHDVAKGVLVLKSCKSQFAIRGGGHMPVSSPFGIIFYILTFRVGQRRSKHRRGRASRPQRVQEHHCSPGLASRGSWTRLTLG